MRGSSRGSRARAGARIKGGHMIRLGMSVRGAERRDEELTLARRVGYDAVEISMDGTGMIFGGRLHPDMLRAALTDFGRHEFWYSLHSPSSLDLRDRANREAQLAVAGATLRFAREVGARILVIHFEQRSAVPRGRGRVRRGDLAALGRRRGRAAGDREHRGRADGAGDRMRAARQPAERGDDARHRARLPGGGTVRVRLLRGDRRGAYRSSGTST